MRRPPGERHWHGAAGYLRLCFGMILIFGLDGCETLIAVGVSATRRSGRAPRTAWA